MKHILPSKQTSERGVTLLIAVLLASVTLAVGMGVYQRTYKEILFASFWKQAQAAFAAADSGLECALYWDMHPSASPECFSVPIATWVGGGSSATYEHTGILDFSLSPTPQCSCDTGGGYECNPGGASPFQFNGTDVGLVCYDQWSGGIPSQVFDRIAVGGATGMPSGSFELNTSGGCAKVTITKPAPSGLSTLIEARGYNDTCVSTNPRRVERGLNIEY